MDQLSQRLMMGATKKRKLAILAGTQVYKFSHTTGIGAKITSGATNLPTSSGGRVGVTSNGTYIGVGVSGQSTGIPAIRVYPFDGNGFGAAVADPVSYSPLSGSRTNPSCAFSPDDSVVVAAYSNSPYIEAWEWTGTGFGARFSNPATMPTDSLGDGIAWSPDGSVIASVSSNNSVYQPPSVAVYAWSSAGFGTKYTNPATGVTPSATSSVTFNPSGTVIAITGNVLDVPVSAWAWSNATGFGTRYANPSTAFTTTYSLAFSPNSDAVFATHTNSPWVSAYAWSDSTGFGSKYQNPSGQQSATANIHYGCGFSPDGKAVGSTGYASPYMDVWAWSTAGGFGSRFANPATILTASQWDFKFFEYEE